ncbi:MAG: PEGA domain-containing protein [Candidatus Acidiferrales bacterium]
MRILGIGQFERSFPARRALEICLFAGLVFATAIPCLAQATAEAAATTGAASVSAGTPKPATTIARNRAQPKSSAHLPASSGPPADEANRKNLEDHAGKNAGKLMLHSTPDGAQIFVNGLYVGHAPLLLLLAPAKYKVEMRGQGLEFGQRTITVAPDETQEVVVTLAPMYPGKVTTR